MPAFLRPFWATPDRETVRLYHGNCLKVLEQLPRRSVQCIVTSPPYWGQRDYGTGTWEGGSSGCDHMKETDHHKQGSTSQRAGRSNIEAQRNETYKKVCGKCGARRIDEQLGNEEVADCSCWVHESITPCRQCYVCRMVEIFNAAWDVLRHDGTLWLNIGDKYSEDTDWRGRRGNLAGVPWRLALALQADLWVLRQDIIWAKPNPMPSSVSTRCTTAHEYIFLLTKQEDYFCDMEAIKEDAKPYTASGLTNKTRSKRFGTGLESTMNHIPVTRANKRSVWTVPTYPYAKAHFACVDSETEALTKQGWKRQEEMQDDEEIAGYDLEQDALTWQPATFNRYHYNGQMVSFEKRDTSQLLTPNHRCLVRTKAKVHVREAAAIISNDDWLLSAPFNESPEKGIGEVLASLVGWYASEGHRGEKEDEACISQSSSANQENVEAIRQLLARVATFRIKESKREWRGHPSNMVTFIVKGLIGRKLRELCPDKCVTSRLTRLPKNELAALFNAFVAGDGHTRKDGRIAITQKDRKHLEMIQVIAIKLGYRAHLSTRAVDGMHVLYVTKGRWLRACGTNGKWNGINTVSYDGVIWCPTVESGFWLARRNGKPFITGNSFPPKLILPCILTGTSAHGACVKCGSPWVRVVQKDRRPTRPGTDSKVLSAGNAERVRLGIHQGGVASSTLGSIVGNRDPLRHVTETKTVGWRPTCGCGVKETRPCVVLDPFVGSGTTAQVCIETGRRCWGIELSEQYLRECAIERVEAALHKAGTGKGAWGKKS